MAYLGLEPKSSHTIKYSQSFELVLFHVMKIIIYCHKTSPTHINEIINYLII